MDTTWLTTMKPSFQTAWLALPPKETHQVLEKIALLSKDPRPDGKVKKQLKYINGQLHRIRCGDYRIFYTFQTPYISLLTLVRRSEDTYDEELDVEFLGGLDPIFESSAKTNQPDWERIFVPQTHQKRPLPQPITHEILTRLQIPEQYHSQLVQKQTQEDLFETPDVPDEILLKLDEVMFERPLTQVLQQPDYILSEINDLQRFKDGELMDFLLKLSPEQEKVAQWSKSATGPTQVKGSPGTGKSTVALYRIQSLIENVSHTDHFRILYTTYTNALIQSSRQLLEKLLGSNASSIEVTTADKLVTTLVGSNYRAANRELKIAEDATLLGALARAIQTFKASSNASLVKAYVKLNISNDYLLEEILQVLMARNVSTIQEYVETKTKRSGRKRGLNSEERMVIWHIYELFLQQLKFTRKSAWPQIRREAEAIFQKQLNKEPMLYDAVVVDEAQDLEPAVIRLLFAMCRSDNRFFITADANQSIYRGSFNWTDVHENLKFRGGRTTILKTNYRSTRQISEAAQSYLAGGALEAEPIESVHIHQGSLPIVRKVSDSAEEIDVLTNFLPNISRECRIPLSSCAILCPTQKKGNEIAAKLAVQGVPAKFMTREQLNLKFPGVKVLTLHSSKGLEFPIVALAGFQGSPYDSSPNTTDSEEQEELLGRRRRTIFVGMTRAMHTLLFIAPTNTKSPLLTGFDTKYWHITP